MRLKINKPVWFIAIVAVLLSACARQTIWDLNGSEPPKDYVPVGQIEIEDRFRWIALTDDNFATEVRKCVPTLPSVELEQTIVTFRGRVAQVVAYGHVSTAASFWFRGNQGMCLLQSSAWFPIFAGEMLLNTVTPVGPPPEIIFAWNRQLAKAIAIHGIARAAYVFQNGNAVVAEYWVDPSSRNNSTLNFSSELKKAGQWRPSDYSFLFTHPALTDITTYKYGDRHSKSLQNY